MSKAVTVRTGLALGLALLVGACENPKADAALYARNALVGMPKKTLLSCAGVPDKAATVDNVEYFTYASRQTKVRSYPTAGFWGGPGWWGGGFSTPLYDTYADTASCQTTFVLRNGSVAGINYGGESDAGVSRLNQCYHIVENCLSLVPPPPQPGAPGATPVPQASQPQTVTPVPPTS
jgi:hypothetical protein